MDYSIGDVVKLVKATISNRQSLDAINGRAKKLNKPGIVVGINKTHQEYMVRYRDGSFLRLTPPRDTVSLVSPVQHRDEHNPTTYWGVAIRHYDPPEDDYYELVFKHQLLPVVLAYFEYMGLTSEDGHLVTRYKQKKDGDVAVLDLEIYPS